VQSRIKQNVVKLIMDGLIRKFGFRCVLHSTTSATSNYLSTSER